MLIGGVGPDQASCESNDACKQVREVRTSGRAIVSFAQKGIYNLLHVDPKPTKEGKRSTPLSRMLMARDAARAVSDYSGCVIQQMKSINAFDYSVKAVGLALKRACIWG